jgi:hypothetical protein
VVCDASRLRAATGRCPAHTLREWRHSAGGAALCGSGGTLREGRRTPSPSAGTRRTSPVQGVPPRRGPGPTSVAPSPADPVWRADPVRPGDPLRTGNPVRPGIPYAMGPVRPGRRAAAGRPAGPADRVRPIGPGAPGDAADPADPGPGRGTPNPVAPAGTHRADCPRHSPAPGPGPVSAGRGERSGQRAGGVPGGRRTSRWRRAQPAILTSTYADVTNGTFRRRMYDLGEKKVLLRTLAAYAAVTCSAAPASATDPQR